MIWLAVAFGGALGSMARHGVNLFFAHALERAVPYATAAVNLIGSAVIGLLAALIATGRLHWSTQAPHVRVRRHPRRLHDVFQLHARHVDAQSRRRSRAGGLPTSRYRRLFGLAAVWGGYRLGIALG